MAIRDKAVKAVDGVNPRPREFSNGMKKINVTSGAIVRMLLAIDHVSVL